VCALTDEIRHHSINADQCQQNGYAGKEAETGKPAMWCAPLVAHPTARRLATTRRHHIEKAALERFGPLLMPKSGKIEKCALSVQSWPSAD
jgi:hypothetical protein